MRLFIGIPLAEAVVGELAAVCAQLRGKIDDLGTGGSGPGSLRWTAAESWHVTLQFLGNTSAEQYGCVVERLGEVRSVAVSIQLAGLGCFERAGIVYAGVEVMPQLVALQRRVTAATAGCGFQPEARPFHPHITLARSKGEGRGRQLSELVGRAHAAARFTRFTAAEFLLYESHLGPGGSKYEVRGRYALGD